MLMLCNTSAKESIETKGSQGNSERRTFVKKPQMGKVSTRAAAAYGRQLKITLFRSSSYFWYLLPFINYQLEFGSLVF